MMPDQQLDALADAILRKIRWRENALNLQVNRRQRTIAKKMAGGRTNRPPKPVATVVGPSSLLRALEDAREARPAPHLSFPKKQKA